MSTSSGPFVPRLWMMASISSRLSLAAPALERGEAEAYVARGWGARAEEARGAALSNS
jgi:hypothetical protein